MSETVKPDLRAARTAATEERILAAARTLFLRDGYVATTLTSVADEAGLGHRTIYVRFGSKAALLKRVIDVAVAGDTRMIDVPNRDWFQTALNAPTLAERLDALAVGTSDLMARAGDLFGVALQAEPIEPVIADAYQAGRDATRDHLRGVVAKMATDGLIDARVDVGWLGDTVAVMFHPDTYVLVSRTMRWDLSQYRTWLHETASVLVQGANNNGRPRRRH